MSPFSLTWDIADLERLTGALVGFRPERVYRQIGEELLSETRLRFREGVSPSGERWEPSKRAQAQGGRTLVDQAILENSISYLVNDDGLTFGPGPLPYAAIHQFGGMAGRGRKVRIPQRQYIPGPDDIDLDDLAKKMATAIFDELGRA